MNRIHQALLDGEVLVQDFRNRRQTIRCARRVRDNVMFLWIVSLLVYAFTTVTSSFLAGAVMITFFTGPCRCFAASSRLVNRPVPSTTISAPTESQSIFPGSRSLKT